MRFYEKILEIIKADLKVNLAYVAFTWATILANIIQIAVFYFIWISIYGEKSYINGISKPQIITYIILSRIIFSQITFGSNLVIADKIQSGDIAMDMLLPLDFQLYNYVGRIGDFIFYIFTNGLPSVLISVILFGISPPASILAGAEFMVSIILSVTIAFFIEFILGMLSFYTTNGWGIQQIKVAVIGFFSGALVPIAFFPDWLKAVINVLPLKDMVYTPIAIYLGIAEGKVIVMQLVWILMLFVASRIVYGIAVRKLTVQGG